jgi:hypothetical protein
MSSICRDLRLVSVLFMGAVTVAAVTTDGARFM